ncbi:MAG: TM0106 family RecB-like putative nuclease [Dermatophilaceae bacterium]
MFISEGRPVLSPSDLRLASACEFAVLRGLDETLGQLPRRRVVPDPMLERVAELGAVHEQAELRRLSAAHPGGVRTMARPRSTREAYAAGMADTLAAIAGDAEVLAQATLFDGRFGGFADFLERTEAGWLVSDTKLARTESVAALLQVGAYAALLADAGVPVAPFARLVLGSGERVDLPLREVLPVYRQRRARLESLVDGHLAAESAAAWGADGVTACGRCEVCEEQLHEHGDLLLVAGMRAGTRRRLLDAGIPDLAALAASEGPVDGVSAVRLERLRAQARLQLLQGDSGGSAASDGVRHEVIDADVLRRLPRPSPGDIFFDFEGDPLWSERGSSVWGLEYLFGLVEVDHLDQDPTAAPRFTAFWAHDRAAEKRALEDFVAHVRARRQRWPELHIYHYAPYEVAALTRLAARHSTCEDAIDDLLRDGVFVDLYATVRGGIRVGQRSYSIKKLEPLYMGARTAEVQKGDDSIVEYHRFRAARDADRVDAAAQILAGIAAYNEEDCISTWRLRDWLVAQAGGVEAVGAAAEARPERVPNDRRLAQLEVEARVRALVEDVPAAERTEEHRAVAMVAASVLYHAREVKPFWWKHYDRILQPSDQWMRETGVATVVGEPEVTEPWQVPPGKRAPRRTFTVEVDPVGGAPLSIGATKALYAAPAAFPAPKDHDPRAAHVLSPASVEIVEAVDVLAPNGRQHQRLTVCENAPGGERVDSFPVAFVPGSPPGSGSIDAALEELADEVVAAHPAMAARAGIDVLLRRPPRLRDVADAALPRVGEGPDRHVDAVTAALRAMSDSYVAVQGPPGTGKTYVGAHVIARLVADGWAVGVTAQSHAAVEHVLDAVVAAGVPGGQVAKEPRHTPAPTWRALRKADDLAGFVAERRAAGEGFVLGGTAWDLTNTHRVGRGSLDLVVVDEAGQFSLAKTLAVSMAGARLLLLGDPAQLPQVSQGTHAEPIDESALGWLAGGAAILPEDLGYFLETTWRMHPRLTEVVSGLAYADQLRAEESVTSARTLDGVDPGLHVQVVDHTDNARWSPEEATAVVDLVRDLLTRTWHDPQERGADGIPVGPRLLTAGDVIVITPFNAQVGTLKVALRDAGLDDVRVGTVDRFQGQEAAVAILSMATSSPAESSRGMDFVLDRQRLNVAISRGKYAAWIVRSPALTDLAPRTPKELLALGAFLALTESGAT